MNKLIIGFLMFLCFSCREDQALTTRWYSCSNELAKWAVTDSQSFRSMFVDNYGITREYIIENNDHEYSLGSSWFAGIKYEVSHREYYLQMFKSNYGDDYHISLQTTHDTLEFGEYFMFSINDLEFEYNFLHDEIVDIETNGERIRLSISSDGIESDTLLKSKLTFLDTLTIDQFHYSRAFHFELNDLSEYWTDQTVKEIIYTQKEGLVCYILNDGNVFNRKWE